MNEEQRKAAQDALDWLNWFGCRSQNRPNKTRQLITDNLAKALQQHAPDDAPDWEGDTQLRHKSTVSHLMGLAVKLKYAGASMSASYDDAYKNLQNAIYKELSTPMTAPAGYFTQENGRWRQCMADADLIPKGAEPLYRYPTLGTLTTYERTLLNRVMLFIERTLKGDEESQSVGEANNLLDEITRHLANSI